MVSSHWFMAYQHISREWGIQCYMNMCTKLSQVYAIRMVASRVFVRMWLKNYNLFRLHTPSLDGSKSAKEKGKYPKLILATPRNMWKISKVSIINLSSSSWRAPKFSSELAEHSVCEIQYKVLYFLLKKYVFVCKAGLPIALSCFFNLRDKMSPLSQKSNMFGQFE